MSAPRDDRPLPPPPPPQHPQQPYYPGPPATNGFAIASLVLGILWLYWLGSVLALVFGFIAKSQIRATNQTGGGMATAGIVLGWIGVGTLLIALLVVIGVNRS